ncbi:MAG: hypothetical protein MZW92_39205 [Comamonadaceae bacterium]|nr:hypothetical protein [Comamonadaceae bacterium]
MDAASGGVLVNQLGSQRLPPASLTKLMTSHVAALELQRGRLKEDDLVTHQRKSLAHGRLQDVRHDRRQGRGQGPAARHHRAVGQRRQHRAGRAHRRRRGHLRRDDEPGSQAPRAGRHPLRQRHRLARSHPLLQCARHGQAGARHHPRGPRALLAVQGKGIRLEQHQAAEPQPAAVARPERRRPEDRPHRGSRLLPGRLRQSQRPAAHRRGVRHRQRKRARDRDRHAARLRLQLLRQQGLLQEGRRPCRAWTSGKAPRAASRPASQPTFPLPCPSARARATRRASC